MTSSLRLLLAVILLSAAAFKGSADDRIPWATPRVTGSPEAPPAFQLQRVYSKLKFASPLDIAYAPGSDRVFVAEQSGKIWSFPREAATDKPDLVVDLKQAVTDWKSVPRATGLDSLYGMAFHPRFQENHFVYLCYALAFPKRTQEPHGTRVSRFTVTGEPPRVQPGSEQILFEWQAGGHNGGCLIFGKDGMLYISAGDQADPNPPDLYQTGQDISDLRASIMRIDVDHPSADKPYSIPGDNPFVKRPGARGEVWCYGLRNPWRMSIDRATGNLWVADVGWELWESIYCAKSGGNYGWSIMEGPNPVYPAGKRGPTPITPPALTLSHAESASITGGFVYRGKKFPDLAGHYIFGDWETRRIWAAKVIDGDKLAPHRTITQTDQRIVGFGEDPDGELVVIDYEGGGLYGLTPNPAAGQPSAFPRRLSDSGLFSDVATQKPSPGVLPFSVNASQWVDSAIATRFVAAPGTDAVRWNTNDVYGRPSLSFPKDSVLVRTLSLETTTGVPASRRKVETQLLHFDGKHWLGYSYRWRDDQTDADLVEDAGDQQRLTIADSSVPGGQRQQTWHFASRAQCMTCHTAWSGYTLAYTHPQLANGDDQLKSLMQRGLLPEPHRPKDAAAKTPSLVDPYDPSHDLTQRARSYLDVNCATCHREGGGGSALIDLRRDKTLPQTHAFNQPPMLGAFGIDQPRILYPGDPTRSVLMYRLSKTGSGHMPKIGSERVDDRGVALINQWIAAMKEDSSISTKAKAEQDAAMRVLQSSEAGKTSDTALTTLLSSTSGALALVGALEHDTIPQPLRQPVIARGMSSPLPTVRDLFIHFSGADIASAPTLGAKFDRSKLLVMTGDPKRGRDIFQNIAQCSSCHIASGVTGREFGPDLSHIASKYTKEQLLEQIVEPSKTIAEGFPGYSVETTEGDLITGFLISQNESEVVIKDATLQLIHIPVAQVKARKPMALSIMPEGLLDSLEPRDAADLLEWLSLQK